jgi:hypothetical protein
MDDVLHQGDLGPYPDMFPVYKGFCPDDVLYLGTRGTVPLTVDSKWHFKFFMEYEYRFLLDVFCDYCKFLAEVIITISRLLLSIFLK